VSLDDVRSRIAFVPIAVLLVMHAHVYVFFLLATKNFGQITMFLVEWVQPC
jgi:hypothetical protein